MKLKYDFIVNEVADQFVAVAVGDGLSEFTGFVEGLKEKDLIA